MRKPSIFVLLCIFHGCQYMENKDNVELTDFTKELISLYLNDEQNTYAISRKNEIIVSSITDETCYYLSVFSNDPNEYKFCREDFIGQTIYLGYLVRVYGNENSAFFFLNKNKKRSKRCKPDYAEYDPLVWHICLNKDYSLRERETVKVAPDNDITVIRSLVDRHFPANKSHAL